MIQLNKRKFHLNIILFVIPLLLLGLLNILLANDSEISQLENRALKSKPFFSWDGLSDGSYFREYDEYFSDTFVFRDPFVQFSGKLKTLKGLGGEKAAIVLHKGANVFQQQDDSDGQSTEDQGYATGRILVLDDKAVEIHSFSPEAGKAYTKVLNDFAAKIGSEVKIYSLLAPTQIAFLNSKMYVSLSSPQEVTLNFVRNNLSPEITPVDVYKTLEDHRDEYVYFRTDHHWTARGAYYAYRVFMEEKNEDPVELEKYEQTIIEDYLGSTYRATLAPQLEKSPDAIHLYQPFIQHEYYIYWVGEEPIKSDLLDMRQAEKNNKYGIFLGGDTPLAQIVTQADSKKKILLIKDSYGNAFVPFLLPHYREIYVVDPRQYRGDLYRIIREKEIDEVMFLNYVLVFDNNGFPELLASLMNS